LQGVLPQDEYFRLTRTDKGIPKQLLKNFSNIPATAGGDLFGQIYEYFLGEFAMAEGQGGGEFFTPRSVVRLMVEIIEPHRGKVFDPACGSGGMFVQSGNFVQQQWQHRQELANADKDDLFVYGQEKTLETVKLAKMNLAVNGLRGDVRQANSYAEDVFDSFGQFDYVLANPPFNVDDVNVSMVEKDRRFNNYWC
jgi:type I restriction enzyme M protein